jgi:hypothetical protein
LDTHPSSSDYSPLSFAVTKKKISLGFGGIPNYYHTTHKHTPFVEEKRPVLTACPPPSDGFDPADNGIFVSKLFVQNKPKFARIHQKFDPEFGLFELFVRIHPDL